MKFYGMDKPNGLMAVSIAVGGNRISANDLDRVFGVKATSTWTAKPEVIAQVPDINKEEWRFELASEACFSFSDAVNRLFKEFEDNLERISQYCLENNLKTSVHIQLYGHQSDFILGFDQAETISKLSRINAEFYISVERLED